MTKKFFSLLSVFSLFAVTIISCSKNSSTPDATYQFKADLNGTEQVFTVLSSAAETTPAGLFSLTLIGVGATESISLNLWSDKDDFLAGKTFTIQGPAGRENVMAYGPNGSTDSTQSYFSYFNYGTVTEQLNCTITERTSTYIKGTFSGYLYKNQQGVPQKIEVTNGTFYARFD